MKKRSKRYQSILKSSQKGKKIEIKETLELVKKIPQQSLMSQSMFL